MLNRTVLSKQAYYSAIKLRKNLNIPLDVPLPIYDTVQNYGIEVRFLDTKSIEGLYSKNPGPTILIGAYRPKGRQVYTCAHELAHHEFDHGTRIDEIRTDTIEYTEEEFLADCFAGYFLMPSFAVNKIIRDKNWNNSTLLPQHILYLSNYFNVGYTTITNHLAFALKIISPSQAKIFKSRAKGDIFIDLVNMKINSDLILLDELFVNSIDVNVDDYILAPNHIKFEGNNLMIEKELTKSKLYRACSTGISRFINTQTDWSKFCRVSKKEYIGRNIFRHLEEVDDD